MARYTQRQAAQAWIQEGGPPRLANLMGRIAIREGGGNTYATNHNTNGTIDRGPWQINSIWGHWSNKSYGSLQGSAQAAVHVYRTQGLKAWATYNPSIDSRYIGTAPPSLKGGGGRGRVRGGVSGGYTMGRPSAPQINVQSTPGVSYQKERNQLLTSYLLSRPLGDYGGKSQGGLTGTLLSMGQITDKPPTVNTSVSYKSPKNVKLPGGGGRQGGGGGAPGGLPRRGIGRFDGKPVAAWIVPILKYARAHGWHGSVSSGYRSRAHQQYLWDNAGRLGLVRGKTVARPGSSNHEGDQFPRGAVDVSNASQLASVLRNSPYGRTLVWAGGADPVHFSHPHGGSY